MTSTIAILTLRECFRRRLPYVLAVGTGLIVIASRLFLAFTFGRQRAEALNLAISGAFLAGFGLTALLGTALVRRDLERKTLSWVLTKPLSPLSYLLGRILGLFAANALLGLAVTLAVAPVLAAVGGEGDQAIGVLDVLAAGSRALPPLLVLSAAAVAVSSVASRVAAPLILLALFLAGSVARGGVVPLIAPDFALFSLDANATAAGPVALLYALVFCSIFTVFGFIVLALRFNANRQG